MAVSSNLQQSACIYQVTVLLILLFSMPKHFWIGEKTFKTKESCILSLKARVIKEKQLPRLSLYRDQEGQKLVQSTLNICFDQNFYGSDRFLWHAIFCYISKALSRPKIPLLSLVYTWYTLNFNVIDCLRLYNNFTYLLPEILHIVCDIN